MPNRLDLVRAAAALLVAEAERRAAGEEPDKSLDIQLSMLEDLAEAKGLDA